MTRNGGYHVGSKETKNIPQQARKNIMSKPRHPFNNTMSYDILTQLLEQYIVLVPYPWCTIMVDA